MCGPEVSARGAVDGFRRMRTTTSMAASTRARLSTTAALMTLPRAEVKWRSTAHRQGESRRCFPPSSTCMRESAALEGFLTPPQKSEADLRVIRTAFLNELPLPPVCVTLIRITGVSLSSARRRHSGGPATLQGCARVRRLSLSGSTRGAGHGTTGSTRRLGMSPLEISPEMQVGQSVGQGCLPGFWSVLLLTFIDGPRPGIHSPPAVMPLDHSRSTDRKGGTCGGGLSAAMEDGRVGITCCCPAGWGRRGGQRGPWIARL